jgi:hypothetical protein
VGQPLIEDCFADRNDHRPEKDPEQAVQPTWAPTGRTTGPYSWLHRQHHKDGVRCVVSQSLSNRSGVARLTSLHPVRIMATLSSSLRMSNMSRTPDSPAAPNA